MKYHQWGTPAVGNEWGVQSKEIDLNTDFSGAPDPAPEPEPQPEGVIMQGIVKAGFTLKVRRADGSDTGMVLRAGDMVYGDVANSRIYYDEIFPAATDGVI